MTIDEIRQKCQECDKCPLSQTRTNVVFGVGNTNAKLMFIGEAPGESEDLSGTPFVGRAGKLLDKFLFAVGINREEVYITNILKCRPPNNRDPLPSEEELCLDYLRTQVKIINPTLIVCVGRIAAMKLIRPDYRIMEEHGKWIKKGNFLFTSVIHPSALLRDPSKNGLMLKDMMDIKAKYDEIK